MTASENLGDEGEGLHSQVQAMISAGTSQQPKVSSKSFLVSGLKGKGLNRTR